ncbi:MAG TPA: DUF2523 family protein [Cellvibrio sp.]|nr:DUF2523 family protein [Cellvibrio sp.]
MFTEIVDFINQIIDLINNFAVNLDAYWERLIVWIIVAYIELKISMVEFSWSIASGVISSVGISQHIQSAWAAIPANAAAFLGYLRIPEAINLIATSYLTRFILGLLP